jgi:imidazolonepropionase-like amidohydrolase
MPGGGRRAYKHRMTTTAATHASSRQLIALRPDAVFDGLGAAPLRDATVLVDGDRILGVETGRSALPRDTTVVDLPGCTLLPGLVDTHVHLGFDAGADPVGELAGRDDQAALTEMARAARQQLHAGVTTVRDLGDRGFLALQLRERGGAAADPLPGIVAAGPPLTVPDGHCHRLGGTAAGVAGVRAAVAEHARRGVDVIKVMASGGFLTPGSDPQRPQYEPDELRAIVDEAHRHGLPVTAHAHSTAAIAAAVDAGVDGLEHCSFLTPAGVDAPDELIDRIVRRRVVVGASLGHLPGFEPPPMIARLLADMFAAMARLHRAGGLVLAATDAGIAPLKPHGVLPHAGADLAAIGFSNHRALRAMTSEAAQVCGVGDRTGRIAPGYDADLLAVRGDPLSDLGALHEVAAVYRAGACVRLEDRSIR